MQPHFRQVQGESVQQLKLLFEILFLDSFNMAFSYESKSRVPFFPPSFWPSLTYLLFNTYFPKRNKREQPWHSLGQGSARRVSSFSNCFDIMMLTSENLAPPAFVEDGFSCFKFRNHSFCLRKWRGKKEWGQANLLCKKNPQRWTRWCVKKQFESAQQHHYAYPWLSLALVVKVLLTKPTTLSFTSNLFPLFTAHLQLSNSTFLCLQSQNIG